METRHASRRELLALAMLLALLAAACGEPQSPAADDSAVDEAADVDAEFHPTLDHLERGRVTLVRADDEERFDVVVTLPNTEAERQRGLMEVPELAEGTGMLFTFVRERTGGFWMKNTLVPLDIAFAADDGEILAVLAMEPCEADPCPSYDPGVAYRYALEVPQGWFDANDLGPGDRLTSLPD